MTAQQSPERRRRRRRRRLLSPRPASTTSSTPAQAATDSAVSLPSDLIFDILSRLPVKSVCRFRCVSREWCALISDAHKSRHTEALVCVAGRFRENKFYYDVRLMDMDGSVIRVVEEEEDICRIELLSTSMDDLVCVTNSSTGTRVIDPATGEVLAHCPEKAFRTVGFGRAVPSGAYKVVGVGHDQTCYVFTPGNDTTWRWSQSPPTHMTYIRRPPVGINGIVYFLVSQEPDNDTLLCFDIEREEWKTTIEGPPKATGAELWKITDPVRIAEFNNALCYVHSEMSNKNRCLNIWLLNDIDKNTWIKAYRIPVPSFTYEYMPLRMTHADGQIKFIRFVCRQGYQLCVYDPRTEKFTALHTLDDGVCKIGRCSLQLDRFVLGSGQRSNCQLL